MGRMPSELQPATACQQEDWMQMHAHQPRNWRDGIALGNALNRQLVAAAEGAPHSAWLKTCTAAGPRPLKFVFEDDGESMPHHLRHLEVEGDRRETAGQDLPARPND
jgi:hypothetical protein